MRPGSDHPTKLALEWHQYHSVGVAEFDAEHQKFLDLVRNLYEAMRINASRGVIGALLGELYAYAASHMTHEEDVLEQHKYPELESHRLEH